MLCVLLSVKRKKTLFSYRLVKIDWVSLIIKIALLLACRIL